MIALLQSTPHAEGVFIPAWMLGAFGVCLVMLLGIIGFLIQFVMNTFREVVSDLKKVVNEAVDAFQSFKDDAPKEFVTHPFFEEARRGLKDDTTRAHKRITELREEVVEHAKNCPAAVRLSRSLEGG